MNNTVANLIKSTKGRIFTVTFIKANGELRTMNCRLGVTGHLRGGKSTTAHKSHLVTVYDMQAKGYRCVNLDTVLSVTISGKTHSIEAK